MKTQQLTYGELNSVSPIQQEILVHLFNGAILRKSNLGTYAMSHSAYGSFHVRDATVRVLAKRRLIVLVRKTLKAAPQLVLTYEGRRYANAISGEM